MAFRRIILPLSILLLVTSCGDTLRSGDLVFQANDASDMVKAIEESTRASSKDLSFSHVGIIFQGEKGLSVIHADPKGGVVETPLEEFLKGSSHFSDGKPMVRFMRVDIPEGEALSAALKAKGMLGRPYDFRYAPGDGELYCSELIWECYTDKEGRHIFSNAPMNFKDSDGNIPKGWQELFDSLSTPVPQGVPGTNPNDMSREKILRPLKVNP